MFQAQAIDEPKQSTGRSTVAVVGLGYVGLPTALSLLDAGLSVIGIDVSPERLTAINSGNVDLLPTDLARLRRHLASEQFDRAADYGRIADADTVIVCVPTPVTPQLVPDLTALGAACRTVVEHARRGQTIILTSTTYVGCTRDLLETPLRDRGFEPGFDVHIAFSPERIDPGVADHDPASTPRVLGGITPDSTRAAAMILRRTCPSLHEVSSPEAAEMAKLLENTFRAVNIAFANEMADVAGSLGLSIQEVVEAAATKPYGFMKFMPGPGVGGHCIPCDPHYLLWQLRGRRVAAPLTDAAMTGIALRPRRVVARLAELLADGGHSLRGARVHVVGVAYKPGVADVRESPALEIIAECRAAGAEVSFTDAFVAELHLVDGNLKSTPVDRVEADVVLVHTAHPGEDLTWLAGHPLVLDATYRLDSVPQRVVV
ncbi:nucleotide sugar dehydrogenase [Cryptosporangium phraense]|uniref:Nucleotide sugar dehydrogenase n=1 Tax=Cryptosporangium phraense TaxID=2593070 RepID=A0A545AUN3_9ACTN|nr:nucleotide sugar dehydrogenase [Cryptosporangium phraense]TQS45050.1 nucleotide sugar dehydrogenase [Cryptosporangium phraense]